jgi:SAM-dependent methyltransferase
LDVGAGPGRFTPFLGGKGTHAVLLDLSMEMLRRAQQDPSVQALTEATLVRGDASSPPFVARAFSLVAALGNVVGHLPRLDWPSLAPLDTLVQDQGTLLIEIVPGFGERSAYLCRLPPKAVARVLRSPLNLVRGRLLREGFRPVPRRVSTDHGFRRLSPAPLKALTERGWRVDETMAVAPALGFDPGRLEATRGDPKAWSHLLTLEEELGHLPARWENAAAVLVALSRIETDQLKLSADSRGSPSGEGRGPAGPSHHRRGAPASGV